MTESKGKLVFCTTHGNSIYCYSKDGKHTDAYATGEHYLKAEHNTDQSYMDQLENEIEELKKVVADKEELLEEIRTLAG